MAELPTREQYIKRGKRLRHVAVIVHHWFWRPVPSINRGPKVLSHPQMASMFNACYVDPGQTRDPYVSPVYATQQDLEGLPPALLILAGGDSLHDEGLQYREMLGKASVVTECHEYPAAISTYWSRRRQTRVRQVQ